MQAMLGYMIGGAIYYMWGGTMCLIVGACLTCLAFGYEMRKAAEKEEKKSGIV